jgi:hypothetical protein
MEKNRLLSNQLLGKSGPEVTTTQQPGQKPEEPTMKPVGKKRGQSKKNPDKDPGPAPLNNAEWARIDTSTAANWGVIWKAQEEEYDLKEKIKN